MSKYKQVISISLGSSSRDHEAIINLLGQEVAVKRIGTDGDLEKATLLFQQYDGKVDAFGLGGTDLGLLVNNKWFPMHSILKIVKHVKKTPIVDGSGLKILLESRTVEVMQKKQGVLTNLNNKKVLIMSGCDRWGLQKSFAEAGFTNIYGDLIFGLGLPFTIKTTKQLLILANLLLPIFSRLPFEWIYPVGSKQLENTPIAIKLFQSVSIIAGDRHYIRKYMPLDLTGKIIVTNTTTEEDMNAFKIAGVKSLITTTPVYNGRSFGTNVLEAAIVAASEFKGQVNYKTPVTYFNWLNECLRKTVIEPQIHYF
jgi:hypothetical protein